MMMASGSLRRAARWQLVLIMTCIGCAPDAPGRNGTARDDTSHAAHNPGPDDVAANEQDAYPARYPSAWQGQTLPPAAALSRVGACPFECCQYGEWWSDSTVTVYATGSADVAFTIPPGTGFTGEGGVVNVTSLARAVVHDGIPAEDIGVPHALAAGDTLYLIEPIGEGAFVVWRRGEEFELPGIWEVGPQPDPRVTLEGEFDREWNAHIRMADGRTGWLPMDRTPQLWGVDACGVPPNRPVR